METPAPWTSGRLTPPVPLMAEEERERIERQIREEAERRRREEEAERRRQQINEDRKRNEERRRPTDEWEPKSN